MADETRRRPASAGGGGWGLHADQSYLGRPVDPNVVARVRGSLDKYRGPRTAADKDKIIAGKVAENQRFDRAISAEYWAWTQQCGEPSFKLPEDPRKGMPSQDEYIQMRVENGLRGMRQDTVEYRAWLESLDERMEAEKLEKLKEKKAADAVFNNALQARYEERRQRKEEAQEQSGAAAAQYWRWLQGMKTNVAKRPSSAPAARSSGVESASSMAQRKKQESMRIQKCMSSEYSEWLRDVSVAKFTLPTAHVDKEAKTRKAMADKQRMKQAQREQSAYFKEVKQMERRHHSRIMFKVKERLDADKRYDEEHEAVAKSLAEKGEAEKERQRAIELKSREELKNIYKRVDERPLFLEVAYGK